MKHVLYIGFLLAIGTVALIIGLAPIIRQPTPAEIAEDVIVRVNAARTSVETQSLVVNEHLMLLAQWRSEDMAASSYFSHTPPEGHPTLGDLGKRLGYHPLYTPAENISMVCPWLGRHGLVGELAVESWRESPGHWGWAMSPYEEMTGVGIAVREDGCVVITQLFWNSGPCGPPSAAQHNR